jgi:hypothetical protein
MAIVGPTTGQGGTGGKTSIMLGQEFISSSSPVGPKSPLGPCGDYSEVVLMIESMRRAAVEGSTTSDESTRQDRVC